MFINYCLLIRFRPFRQFNFLFYFLFIQFACIITGIHNKSVKKWRTLTDLRCTWSKAPSFLNNNTVEKRSESNGNTDQNRSEIDHIYLWRVLFVLTSRTTSWIIGKEFWTFYIQWSPFYSSRFSVSCIIMYHHKLQNVF